MVIVPPVSVTVTLPAPCRLMRLLSFVTTAGTTFSEAPFFITPKSQVTASNCDLFTASLAATPLARLVIGLLFISMPL